MLNVFNSIRKTSRRTEPIHSQFLADALIASTQSDRSLFDAVWRLAAPQGWDVPNCPDVHAEFHTGNGRRIDICIVDDTGPKKRVLGIEVKTSSASAQSNQLETYHQGLTEKFPGAGIAIVYLTPFNRRRAGEAAARFPTIGIFEEFARKSEYARHLSWLDIAEIEWDGRDIWRQHQSHVRDVISSQKKLKPDTLQNHSFDKFFGVEPAEHFWEALAEMGVFPDATGAEVDLANPDLDESLLTRAFEILILDGDSVAKSVKSDRFGDDQRRPFITSPHGRFHEAMFDLSRRFENVWVQGTKDYAIRVAHRRYGSGVSLVRSKDAARLETGRPRRARQP